MIEKYNIYVGILKLSSQSDFTRPIMNFPQTMRMPWQNELI